MEKIDQIQDLIEILNSWSKDVDQMRTFENLTSVVFQGLQVGQKVFFAGNGGSAAEASHLAAEFVGKCVTDTGPLPAISLSDSSVILSAVANDWNFDEIFSRQLKALGNPGDIFIGLSTSGKSPNIIDALETCRALNIITSLWTSQRVPEKSTRFVDYLLIAPTNSTPRAQELHLLIGHAMAEKIEIMSEN